MKWFKLSNLLVPSNMIFFVEDEEEGNKKWEWVHNGTIMYRVDSKRLQKVINFLSDDISKTRHILTLDNL